VDGKVVTGIELEAIHQRLQGSIGSRIAVTLVRPGGTQTVTLTRALIVPETVVFERQGSVAYFRLYSFNQETTSTLSAAVKRAKDEIGPELAGIVLDLRDNPGGLLDQAIAVSDLFIGYGPIITMRGRHPDSRQRFEATKGDIADGLPVVVLVNGNSASASEIVAVALQDSGRAVVAGTASYGKGVIQTVIRMPNQGELTLTSAQVYAPSGYSIDRLGVLPSVCTAVDSVAEPILAALKDRKVAPLPITLRNSVTPEDMPLLDRLRSGCPARKTDEPVDVDVAIKLVENGALYRQALDLALMANEPRELPVDNGMAGRQCQPQDWGAGGLEEPQEPGLARDEHTARVHHAGRRTCSRTTTTRRASERRCHQSRGRSLRRRRGARTRRKAGKAGCPTGHHARTAASGRASLSV
jgi:carboxyl-terminal processing protease